MQIYEICFSPTGGTKEAADCLAGALGGPVTTLDLTNPAPAAPDPALTGADLAVIAVPSYGGRVPAPAVQRLRAIQGGGAAAVLVCVYGNRAYEDTLVELRDAADAAGFRVIAAVAAVAEHSIARQFAAGRPDAADCRQLADFAARIRAKQAAGDTAEPAIPGNRPYKKAGGTGLVPKPTGACTGCGTCARSCPVQAIDRNDPKKVDAAACISCMRCVSVCPEKARRVNPVMLAAVGLALKKVCAGRKENELFL